MYKNTQDLLDLVNTGTISDTEFFERLEQEGFRESAEWTWEKYDITIMLYGFKNGRFTFEGVVTHGNTCTRLVSYLRS